MGQTTLDTDFVPRRPAPERTPEREPAPATEAAADAAPVEVATPAVAPAAPPDPAPAAAPATPPAPAARADAAPQAERSEAETNETPPKRRRRARAQPAGQRMRGQRTRAHELASEQRDIPISEFFEQNRHILGFDNPTHALITSVKEGVDNSLDACEQGGVLPDIVVTVESIDTDELRVTIEDNGPGLLAENLPNVFGRLLYGSRFGSGIQSRGQQGIGISAAIMYGQLTTGRHAVITTRIGVEHPAVRVTMKLDTRTNRGVIDHSEPFIWRRDDGSEKEHGTRVAFALRGRYREAKPSVLEYLRATAIVNPHATITFTNPSGEVSSFPRAVEEMPPLPTMGIKAHPHGVELGQLLRMAHHSGRHQMAKFLRHDFSSMGARSITNVLQRARLSALTRPQDICRAEAKALLTAFQACRIRAPPSDCLAPIGERLIKLGLKNVLEKHRPEYYTQPVTRAPSVYAGTPFLAEAGMVFGGNLPRDQPVQVLRFANRVPLLYQPGGCVITKAIHAIDWRQYGLEQRGGKGHPIGPAIILVHVASTNVPFTSEAKEAIAAIREIERDIKLALRGNAKSLSRHLKKQQKRAKLSEKFELVQKVLPAIAEKTAAVVGRPVPPLEKVVARIMDIIWIEDHAEFSPAGVSVTITITNYRLRQANFKLRVEVPGHAIAEADPRPGRREGDAVIWSIRGLGATTTCELRFTLPGLQRTDYDGVELWVEGLDHTHIIGAEPWSGAPQ